MIISTYAGKGSAGSSEDGGVATSAYLNNPSGVAVSSSGLLFIADTGNNKIRVATSAGIISTYAGTGTAGSSGDGGAATSAQLNNPTGVAVSSSGLLYIADYLNNVIRVVDASGTITTYAGTGFHGSSGDGGAATSAELNNPAGVAVSPSGLLYIADTFNNKIRVVSSACIISTYAGTGVAGFSGDGGAATSAELNYPYGGALDSSGNLYVADTINHVIRVISSTGIIVTYAGTIPNVYSGVELWGSTGDGGAATNARLHSPSGVVVSASGSLYIADTFNNKIRVISSAGIITTYVGTGVAGSSGDGGAANNAQLSNPVAVAVGLSGSLYIADSGNNKIRLAGLTAVPTTSPAAFPTTTTIPSSQVKESYIVCTVSQS